MARPAFSPAFRDIYHMCKNIKEVILIKSDTVSFCGELDRFQGFQQGAQENAKTDYDERLKKVKEILLHLKENLDKRKNENIPDMIENFMGKRSKGLSIKDGKKEDELSQDWNITTQNDYSCMVNFIRLTD